MAAPRTTIWTLEPHTRAKHEILRRYLQAWMPILTQGGFPEVAYIDGFAGPGRYAGGEDGSPIIALTAALNCKPPISGTVEFLFIEEKTDRADVLQQIIDGMPLPTNFSVKVEGACTFENAFTEFRAHHLSIQGRLPPTFAFIDPFGWTGAPFSVVQFILNQPNCEVFVTFMYEEINRFIGHPDQGANFDSFFGTTEWRGAMALTTPAERNRFLHDLYLRQLRTTGGTRYVRSFQMRNAAGMTDYYLFYATNHLLGLKRMKAAMWKVDESGEFTFSDATDPKQMVLFSKEPRYDLLRQQVIARFCGHDTTVGEVEEFVLAETAFRETHMRHVLRELERSVPPGLVVLNAPPNRRRGTFGDRSMRLRFE